MTLARLVPQYRGRVLVPVLGPVSPAGTPTGSGHPGLRAIPGRLRRPGREPRARVPRASVPGPRPASRAWSCWSWSGADALADPIAALPIGPQPDLRALPVGRCEDGTPWLLKLHGTHVLDRRGDRGGQGLGHLVGGAGDAPL